MSSDTTSALISRDDVQRLLDRISDLQQELWNTRRLQETIERNNRMFEALLASSHDGIALTRLDGILIRVIRSVAGWNPAELAGVPVFRLIHPDDVKQMRECYRQIAEKRVAKVSHEVRLMRPDGSSIRVVGTVSDMLDDPAVQAIVHNYASITEGKSQELVAAIQQAPFAAFSKSKTGEILTWNRGAQEMFGYRADEIIGRSVSVLVPPERSEEAQRCLARVIEQGAAHPVIHTQRLRKDGSRIPIALVLCPAMSGERVEGVIHLSYPLSASA
ncbi:MAG: PAS domain S-box protein [Candidatus Sulfopaludibacter sp.]|nr:PAS domain S-box protein [Candidatus Sulfopaludibacter sp.]